MAEAESEAKAGVGTVLQMGQGTTPETYVDVAETMDIKMDGVTVDVKERTHFGSPSGFKEKIGVLADGGSITTELLFRPDDSTQEDLWTIASTVPQEPRNWRIIGGQQNDPLFQLDFKAVVAKLPVAVPHDNVMTGSLVLDVSGPITLT
jgi:predicted secreted protein